MRSRDGLTGPLAHHVPGFVAELAALGYSKSATFEQVQLLGMVSGWLDSEVLAVDDLVTERLEPFFAARRAAGCSRLRTSRSLGRLVSYLRRIEALAAPEPVASADPVAAVVERFGVYLTSERGLVEGTVRFYTRVAWLFLSELAGADVLDLAGLGAAEVTAFTTRRCSHLGVSSARQTVSALRSFLRFLRLEAVVDVALDQAVLSVAGWNPSLPRAIDAAQVAQLLTSCDRHSGMGRRDYAILVLLARLGLRSGEIVTLELGDIDWRAGEIMVRGKRSRRDRLPLPVDVGEALAGYLRFGRPRSASRRVFLRNVTPLTPLAGSGAVRSLLARACARAGVSYVCPHRLRHSVATEMLRQGVALADIGQVLRHRSTVTTAVYAKADPEQVRALARPWPAGAA